MAFVDEVVSRSVVGDDVMVGAIVDIAAVLDTALSVVAGSGDGTVGPLMAAAAEVVAAGEAAGWSAAHDETRRQVATAATIQ